MSGHTFYTADSSRTCGWRRQWFACSTGYTALGLAEILQLLRSCVSGFAFFPLLLSGCSPCCLTFTRWSGWQDVGSFLKQHWEGRNEQISVRNVSPKHWGHLELVWGVARTSRGGVIIPCSSITFLWQLMSPRQLVSLQSLGVAAPQAVVSTPDFCQTSFVGWSEIKQSMLEQGRTGSEGKQRLWFCLGCYSSDLFIYFLKAA